MTDIINCDVTLSAEIIHVGLILAIYLISIT